jgi:uncharacterized protein YgbK (DUF1537 family)
LTPRIGFYGDDFTGATDTLAVATRAGLRTLLFLRTPTGAELAAAGPLDCVGIAGIARSLSPEAMGAELKAPARLFAELRTPVVHYKCCSTFDSSPAIGSIGAAVGFLRSFVANRFVPVVGGQPNLGRYCVFGNLFAAYETGGPAFRIDRHPTMRQHPVTPMDEADLRVHLARQGLERVESVSYTAYAQAATALDASIAQTLATAPDAVLFDVARAGDLASVGRIMWQHAERAPLLAVGPSSVVQALAAHWGRVAIPGAAAEGTADGAAPVPAARGPVFAIAGSLSPVTAGQIAAATSYTRVAIDAPRIAAGDPEYVEVIVDRIAQELRAGRHVLAHTSGTVARRDAGSHGIATGCGAILKRVLAAAPVRRAGVAGGDTSSHALKALEITALSHAGDLAPGAALCRAHAPGSPLDGLELMLKGGQMGGIDLFERLAA